MMDIETISAGGGSVAWVDHGGGLQIGPQSAGAVPGPACYALGGERATVTDAGVVLGLIHPDDYLGGAMHINSQFAQEAIQRDIAAPLSLGVEKWPTVWSRLRTQRWCRLSGPFRVSAVTTSVDFPCLPSAGWPRLRFSYRFNAWHARSGRAAASGVSFRQRACCKRICCMQCNGLLQCPSAVCTGLR